MMCCMCIVTPGQDHNYRISKMFLAINVKTTILPFCVFIPEAIKSSEAA